jgi:SP family sugar:H+ symporter-like MFS transporter
MMCTFYVLGGMILSIQNDNGGSMISHPGAAVGAKGYVAMICIYIFAIGFECSWGPMTWIICAEVLPTPIRAMGLSIATAFNWAMNAIIAKVTPLMITNLTYGAYFFYGSMAFIMGLFVFFFVPETKGLSLEEINNVSISICIFYA